MEWVVKVTIVQVSAVVVGFDKATGVFGIRMEGVEVCTSSLGWSEVLGEACSGLEHLVLDGLGLALDGIGGGGDLVHVGGLLTC